METQITQKGPVLNEKGHITAGYSTSSISQYKRSSIKAPFYRIKEWDFYQISDSEKCLQFTFGHASYAGQVGIMLFDFKKGEMIADINTVLPLPFSSLNLPEDAEAESDVQYNKNGTSLRFQVVDKGNTRYLSFSSADFETKITLKRQNPNSLVIHIPFDEYKTAFYYNQKINCMTAEGTATYKGKAYTFGQDAFGLLDWGRGVWPFHNEWYWSNATGMVDGKIFGFNLGTGFGNTSIATENMLFYNNEAHKIGKVNFDLGANYMDPWHLYDNEGRLDIKLVPTYDRTTKTKLLFIDNCCHQMFGGFYGTAILNDGTKLQLNNLQGFAEHAVNNW